MFSLFDDQRDVLRAVSGQFQLNIRRVLLTAPTGSGKTVIACFAAGKHLERGGRVWIAVHREELIDQTVTALRRCDLDCGVVAPGYEFDHTRQIQVVSVFSILRRLDLLPRPTFLIVDEAHHAVSSTTWGELIAACPDARILGLTATPCRRAGGGLFDCFDKLVIGPTVNQLIALGRLSPLTAYAPSAISVEGLVKRHGDYVLGALAERATAITGDAVKHYQRIAPGKQMVAFCVSVEHAHQVAARFAEAGVEVEAVDGSMGRFDRRSVIERFRTRELQGLVSCDLISEGFDVPGIEVGISLRPTASLPLWLQQSGRILRTAPGKERAILLDHAGNTLRHGLPTDDREWSLDGLKSTKAENVSVRICQECFAVSRISATHCQVCGVAFPVKPRRVVEVSGELSEVDPAVLAQARLRTQAETRGMQDLIELGRQRGYKNPYMWAKHIVDARKARGRF